MTHVHVIGCRQPYLVESWVPTEEGEYREGDGREQLLNRLVNLPPGLMRLMLLNMHSSPPGKML